MFAANAGAHQIAHLLQNEGADLSVTNNTKMTALHCAAAKYVHTTALADLQAILCESDSDVSFTANTSRPWRGSSTAT